ncbi:MAG: hypothetical protein B6D55_06740, partial [Candidatus Omnitrophica bacterium 4484_70.2]
MLNVYNAIKEDKGNVSSSSIFDIFGKKDKPSEEKREEIKKEPETTPEASIYTPENLRKVWDTLWRVIAQELYRKRKEGEEMPFQKEARLIYQGIGYEEEIANKEADAMAGRIEALRMVRRAIILRLPEEKINESLLRELLKEEVSDKFLEKVEDEVLSELKKKYFSALRVFINSGIEALQEEWTQIKEKIEKEEETIREEIDARAEGRIKEFLKKWESKLKGELTGIESKLKGELIGIKESIKDSKQIAETTSKKVDDLGEQVSDLGEQVSDLGEQVSGVEEKIKDLERKVEATQKIAEEARHESAKAREESAKAHMVAKKAEKGAEEAKKTAKEAKEEAEQIYTVGREAEERAKKAEEIAEKAKETAEQIYTVGRNCFLTLVERQNKGLGRRVKERIEELKKEGKIANFGALHKILNEEIEKLRREYRKEGRIEKAEKLLKRKVFAVSGKNLFKLIKEGKLKEVWVYEKRDEKTIHTLEVKGAGKDKEGYYIEIAIEGNVGEKINNRGGKVYFKDLVKFKGRIVISIDEKQAEELMKNKELSKEEKEELSQEEIESIEEDKELTGVNNAGGEGEGLGDGGGSRGGGGNQGGENGGGQGGSLGETGSSPIGGEGNTPFAQPLSLPIILSNLTINPVKNSSSPVEESLSSNINPSYENIKENNRKLDSISFMGASPERGPPPYIVSSGLNRAGSGEKEGAGNKEKLIAREVYRLWLLKKIRNLEEEEHKPYFEQLVKEIESLTKEFLPQFNQDIELSIEALENWVNFALEEGWNPEEFVSKIIKGWDEEEINRLYEAPKESSVQNLIRNLRHPVEWIRKVGEGKNLFGKFLAVAKVSVVTVFVWVFLSIIVLSYSAGGSLSKAFASETYHTANGNFIIKNTETSNKFYQSYKGRVNVLIDKWVGGAKNTFGAVVVDIIKALKVSAGEMDLKVKKYKLWGKEGLVWDVWKKFKNATETDWHYDKEKKDIVIYPGKEQVINLVKIMIERLVLSKDGQSLSKEVKQKLLNKIIGVLTTEEAGKKSRIEKGKKKPVVEEKMKKKVEGRKISEEKKPVLLKDIAIKVMSIIILVILAFVLNKYKNSIYKGIYKGYRLFYRRFFKKQPIPTPTTTLKTEKAGENINEQIKQITQKLKRGEITPQDAQKELEKIEEEFTSRPIKGAKDIIRNLAEYKELIKLIKEKSFEKEEEKKPQVEEKIEIEGEKEIEKYSLAGIKVNVEKDRECGEVIIRMRGGIFEKIQAPMTEQEIDELRKEFINKIKVVVNGEEYTLELSGISKDKIELLVSKLDVNRLIEEMKIVYHDEEVEVKEPWMRKEVRKRAERYIQKIERIIQELKKVKSESEIEKLRRESQQEWSNYFIPEGKDVRDYPEIYLPEVTEKAEEINKAFKDAERRVEISSKENYISEAKRYLKEEKYDKAIEIAKEILKINPKSLEAHRILFEAYYGKGDSNMAIAIYGEFEDLSSEERLQQLKEKTEMMFKTGIASWQTGEKEKAIGMIKKAIEINPDIEINPELKKELNKFPELKEEIVQSEERGRNKGGNTGRNRENDKKAGSSLNRANAFPFAAIFFSITTFVNLLLNLIKNAIRIFANILNLKQNFADKGRKKEDDDYRIIQVGLFYIPQYGNRPPPSCKDLVRVSSKKEEVLKKEVERCLRRLKDYKLLKLPLLLKDMWLWLSLYAGKTTVSLSKIKMHLLTIKESGICFLKRLEKSLLTNLLISIWVWLVLSKKELLHRLLGFIRSPPAGYWKSVKILFLIVTLILSLSSPNIIKADSNPYYLTQFIKETISLLKEKYAFLFIRGLRQASSTFNKEVPA